MTRQPEPREQWEGVAAELRAYRQAERQAWGDLDDIQVARYLAGVCSPQERAAVEQAMQTLPDVRDVIEVLRAVEPARGMDSAVRASSARVAAGLRTPWKWALAGAGLAATFLLGLLVGPALRPSSHELLVASLTAIPRDSRAPDAAQVKLDDEGVYRITGGKDFAIEIGSPRPGVATVVLLGPGPPTVYPLPGQVDIPVEPFRPRKFGPLDRPDAQTTVLVIVTATPAAEVIRQHLTAEAAAADQPDRLLGQLEQALWQAGHRWAALGRMTVEPVERK
jgi:hypothetical protein